MIASLRIADELHRRAPWAQQEQVGDILQETAALQRWLSGMCATVVHTHLLWALCELHAGLMMMRQ